MDSSIFRWFNRLADSTGWAHGIVTAYAKYGIVLLALLILGAYLDGRRRGDPRQVAASVWTVAASLLALGLGQIIGHLVDRPRPYDTLSNVHVLVARTADFSFPSDHATAAGAVAAGLLIADRRWGLIASVLAVAMALARVYVGAHYPSDVVAGLLLGAVVAGGGGLIAVPLLTRAARWMCTTRLRILVAGSSPPRENENEDDTGIGTGSGRPSGVSEVAT